MGGSAVNLGGSGLLFVLFLTPKPAGTTSSLGCNLDKD